MSKKPVTREMLVNALNRNLSTMFPGFFGGDTKHPHFYRDYGYPEVLTFENFHQMYKRNGIAKAGVDRAIETCWSTYPELQEQEDTHEQTNNEKQIADLFKKLMFWSRLAEADTFSRIGQYAGVIFRFRDGLAPDKPVGTVSGGLEGLAEIIPVHQGQLKALEFHSDSTKEEYGQVKMYQFTENSITNTNEDTKLRQFPVHPDRVHIWSRNQTVWNEAILESGYNDLVTIQKVNGAGGEGFWKNAKAAPILDISPETPLQTLATMLGVQVDEIGDKLDEIINDYNRGLDSSIALQGIKVDLLSVNLPDPEPFVLGPMQSFAASISIPLKILIGSQTGERASTEDVKEWNKTCNSRRENYIKPNVEAIIERLVKYKILPSAEWYLRWADLTESSSIEKADLGAKMADINEKCARTGDEIPFDSKEIREVMGWKERTLTLPKPRPKDPKPDPNLTD
jgi:hypothetical protein